MFTKTLSKNTLSVLKKLGKWDKIKSFVLVGGTALALELGHRKSEDLDFFSKIEFRSTVLNEFHNFKKIKTIGVFNNSVEVFLDDIKVFFMYWAYPLTKPRIRWGEIYLADPVDIALMKLFCLQGRSRKKDIIDLYFINEKIISVNKLVKMFEKRFSKESFNRYNTLKQLINIEILETDPMPEMLVKKDWDEMYFKVISQIKLYLNNKKII